MKKTITEAQLQRIVTESVERVLNEGFMDSLKGAAKGFGQGAGRMEDENTSLHMVSSALSTACSYFGKIYKLIAPLQNDNPQIAKAMQVCKEAYKECKGEMNRTCGMNSVTPNYGAQRQPEYND